MKLRKEDLLLYAITDRSWLNGESLASHVERAIKGGVTMVQLREKSLDHTSFLTEAIEIQNICHKYEVPFMINDNVFLAREIDADGIHIGQNDMNILEAQRIIGRDKIIGVTAKTVEQALYAQKCGADYLGSGAVFGSNTKLDAKTMSHELLQEICASVTIPVVAIGGITEGNILSLKGRGIAGAAVVSGIFAQPNVEAAARKLRDKINNMMKD